MVVDALPTYLLRCEYMSIFQCPAVHFSHPEVQAGG